MLSNARPGGLSKTTAEQTKLNGQQETVIQPPWQSLQNNQQQLTNELFLTNIKNNNLNII